MSKNSKIQWTNHTGGPWFGCTEVSPGCTHCYARELLQNRLAPIIRRSYKLAGFADWETRPVWGKTAPRVLTKGFWNEARRVNASAQNPGRAVGGHGVTRPTLNGVYSRPKWFPSMIDWLDDMPAGIIDQAGNRLDSIQLRADFLRLVFETPNIEWLLLTKRAEKWRPCMDAVLERVEEDFDADRDAEFKQWLDDWFKGRAPDHVQIGISVENPRTAQERIPDVLAIPAKIRFLSVEPMLEEINFPLAAPCGYYCECDSPKVDWPEGHRPGHGLSGIHWVIFGGESGPGARPCNIEWIRSGVEQCRAGGVAVFVKQLGSHWAGQNAKLTGRKFDPKGGDMSEWPEDLRVREWPTEESSKLEVPSSKGGILTG